MNATIVSFKQAPVMVRMSTARPPREPETQESKMLLATTDQAMFASRIDRRGEAIHYLLKWLREAAFCMVNGWHELFALGCKYEQITFDERTNRVKSRDIPDGKIKDYVKDLEEGLVDGIRFFERCGQIYAEEMATVDTLAAKARERVARRIEEEFPNSHSGIPDALRQNDPQKWASEMDWS